MIQTASNITRPKLYINQPRTLEQNTEPLMIRFSSSQMGLSASLGPAPVLSWESNEVILLRLDAASPS